MELSEISKRICPYCDIDGVYVRLCMDCGNVLADEAETDLYVTQLEANLGQRKSLQDRIFTWGRETFGPGQRSGGVFAHLAREIKELGKSLPEIAPVELADCTILLFELAGFAGADLLEEVEKKFKINQGRKWGPIEANGSILHIEEE